MKEQWRAVIGFTGLYEVSDFGRVRSLDRIVTTSSGARKYKGRVLKQTVGSHGYLAVALARVGHVGTATVHRLVLEAFVGPAPLLEEGRHLDCDKSNNTLRNLAYGTRATNRSDSRIAGTLAVGERIAQHKLTQSEVATIRAADGRHEDIAADYGMSRGQISRIKRRENWRHV